MIGWTIDISTQLIYEHWMCSLKIRFVVFTWCAWAAFRWAGCIRCRSHGYRTAWILRLLLRSWIPWQTNRAVRMTRWTWWWSSWWWWRRSQVSMKAGEPFEAAFWCAASFIVRILIGHPITLLGFAIIMRWWSFAKCTIRTISYSNDILLQEKSINKMLSLNMAAVWGEDTIIKNSRLSIADDPNKSSTTTRTESTFQLYRMINEMLKWNRIYI